MRLVLGGDQLFRAAVVRGLRVSQPVITDHTKVGASENLLVSRSGRLRLKLHNGPLDPQPDHTPFVILTFPKLIRPLRRDNLRVLAVLADQQCGGTPDVDVGDQPCKTLYDGSLF